MTEPRPNPTHPAPLSARILRYLLWASELGLALTLLYVLATQGAKPRPATTPAATPAPAGVHAS